MSFTSLSRSSERTVASRPGLPMLAIPFVLLAGAIWAFWQCIATENLMLLVAAVVLLLLGGVAASGFYMVQPNTAVAVTLFGDYQGTDRANGLRWVLPWLIRKKISMRVRNVTSDTLKVNDKNGNPIEIAANVVWRVQDSAQALFDVEDFEGFCHIEIDTALRDLAAHYAYDHAEEGELTLRANAEEVSQLLGEKLRPRLAIGGMTVDEARISHLAFAPEIAGAMLKRQQAEAILAARAKIVAGAVGMVESALQALSQRSIVNLDEERKAQMVTNLLVVLCSDRETQPVLNAGSLY
jgi:regulator of protease activity HflC (stomatin/prohibitin superfamily)